MARPYGNSNDPGSYRYEQFLEELERFQSKNFNPTRSVTEVIDLTVEVSEEGLLQQAEETIEIEE